MAATRPRYCGVLLVAALWLTAGLVCPGQLAAQRTKRPPPPPPFAALFPLEEAWMITLPALPAAPAAHDDTRVFVPLVSQRLAAFDWQHGDDLWSIPLAVTSAPVPANGVVYVAGGSAIHALDAATGAARWMSPTDTPARLVRLAGERVIAVGTRGIQAFDAAAGAAQWSRPLDDGGDPVGAVTTTDSLFVTFAKGAVLRVALDDGRVLWTHTLGSRPSPPLAVKDSVYVGGTDNRFYALDAKDGDVRWSWRTGGDIVGAAADAKAVYYSSLDAVVRAVNPGNGHQRWKRDGGTRPVATPPLILDGSVLVAGLSPALSGFNPLTGVPQGTFDLPGDVGEVHGTPLVAGMLVPRTVSVAVVLKDGRLFGLRSLALMFNESAPQPLLALPGKPLTRERLP